MGLSPNAIENKSKESCEYLFNQPMLQLQRVMTFLARTKTRNDLKPPTTIYNHLKKFQQPPTTTTKTSTTTRKLSKTI